MYRKYYYNLRDLQNNIHLKTKTGVEIRQKQNVRKVNISDGVRIFVKRQFLIISAINDARYTDKKENKSFFIYKEIQMGAVDMTKGFLKYEEMCKYFGHI